MPFIKVEIDRPHTNNKTAGFLGYNWIFSTFHSRLQCFVDPYACEWILDIKISNNSPMLVWIMSTKQYPVYPCTSGCSTLFKLGLYAILIYKLG